MPIIIESAHDANKAHREERAEAVIDRFGGHLPDRQLLCFLDNLDWDELKADVGMANRGLFFLTRGVSARLPSRLRELVMPSTSVPAFEEVIYLHGSTCVDDIGLTLTFAHELQHFVQHATSFDLWLIGTFLTYLAANVLDLQQLQKLGIFKWADLPHELEARIVSKRVALELFNETAVHNLIRQRIDEAIHHRNEQDRVDWEFIRNLPMDADCNLTEETLKFLPTLRSYKLEFQRWLEQGKDIAGFTEFNLDDWLE